MSIINDQSGGYLRRESGTILLKTTVFHAGRFTCQDLSFVLLVYSNSRSITLLSYDIDDWFFYSTIELFFSQKQREQHCSNKNNQTIFYNK